LTREGRTKQLPFVVRRRGQPRFPEPADHATLTDGRVARLERVACCLCGNAAATRLIAVRDWGYGLTRDTFLIERCPRCGLAYLNPRPVREDMGMFYPTRYYERRQDIGVLAPPVRRMSDDALAEQEALCKEAGPAGGPRRVLDVGCASGMFLARMKKQGWSVQGVEVSAEAAEWGVRELEVDIINRPLTESGLPPEQFDVVTFWSALEHVHDPMSYLAEARRLLKPEGSVVILIPNFSSPTVRYLHWGLDPPRHLYHFTPDSLRRALRAAGFDGPIDVRSRTRIEEGSFHRQVAKIGRRLVRYFRAGENPDRAALPGVWAGWVLVKLSWVLAPVSWALTAAGLNGPMIVIAHKSPLAAATTAGPRKD
jgi:SAM-dependent methyltransferase